MTDEGGGGGDVRLNWLRTRIESTFPHVKSDKLTKALEEETNVEVLNDFLSGNIASICFCGDNIQVSEKLPKRLAKGKVRAFLRADDGQSQVPKENIGQAVVTLELGSEPLEHLEQVLKDIYVPLLSNNQDGWGEVATKEIMDRLHHFLSNVSITVGQTQGQTCLPLPPVDNSAAPLNPKDRIHLLEGAVITWSKQIKNVLKQDPETLLKQGLHPTPDLEIVFWKNKAANLNAIFDQLQSERIRRVLQFLDASKSTYCTPFAKLCKEVFAARLEANDNVKYLRTLENWFDRLNNDDDFPKLTELFKPMLHILLLIWKNSKFYNIPARLVVLIREICNALVNQACSFVSGKQIFDLIADEAAGEAVEKLRSTLRVCQAFKTTYLDYKQTANAECPSNPWRIQNNALFMRLDAFLERCHDILDLTQTIVQFGKLAKIEIGGTKGKSLTVSVQQIHTDFESAVENFKNVPYDIMNVDKKEFDDDFYEFRCRIKELERRLASVLTQGFDDCATIYGKFKLLDSFDGLLERPIIQDELERKHISLVQSYGQDLKKVQELFLTEREAPPIAWNLPPIAGALTWCRGLKERIMEPMAKLRQLNKSIMEREEAKEVTKVYSTIMSSLEDYEHQKVEEWGSDVERSSQAKLKLSLLTKGRDSRTNRPKLAVNFDAALVRLLREVKYFLLLRLEVPTSALDIYKKAETFRRQTGNLDLIVNMFNRIMQELLPVEAPLLKPHLKRIDSTLQTGIKDMNWKSSNIDNFITDANTAVKTAYDVLFELKGNLKAIHKLLSSWAEHPLIERKPKPVLPAEFEAAHKQLRTTRFDELKAGSSEIDKTVKASLAVMNVSASNKHWMAYVDFVSSVVIEGLAALVRSSLEAVVAMINHTSTGDRHQLPLLLVDLQLMGEKVRFQPRMGRGVNGDGLRDIVETWVGHFYKAVTMVKRVDGPDGRYMKDIVDDITVQSQLAMIDNCISHNEAQLTEFRAKYEEYDWLWTTDLKAMFEKFKEDGYINAEVHQEVEKRSVDDDDGEGDEQQQADDVQVVVVRKPDLSKFDAEVTRLRGVQRDIVALRTPTDLGWVRVNSEPMKLALSKCVAKWSNLFTEHLQNYVVNELRVLQEFSAEVDAGLNEPVTADDESKEPLKRCMGYIRDVKKSMAWRGSMFEPLRETVGLLKKHGVSMEGVDVADGVDVLQYLDSAPLKWEATVNKTFRKREEIFPLQTAEMDRIKVTVEEFFLSVRAFRSDFRKNAPFTFSGTPTEAYAVIDGYVGQLHKKEEEASELNHLEELFELPVSKYNEMGDTRTEMVLLKQIWDFKFLVTATYDDWQTALWTDIDTEMLEDHNKKLLQEIKRMGDRHQIVKGWTVYRDTEQLLRDMAIALPLVNELHSPAMRPRHWKELARVFSRKNIDPSDSKFCLEDLLELQLHTKPDDVSEIVETASKELKIEKKMTAIEEVWSKLELEYVPHKDSDVLIVKVSDEVVESLEEHQLELQSIIGMGKFVDYFRTRVETWQRNLGIVESVLKEWMSVTKAWCSLESIFLASADIRAQLPDDTKRFEGIDQEFKELMKQAVDTPIVVDACTKEGREESLKNMTRNLELCQKSLNEYLDMKKKIFPRFYFVSNVALLDILSNGNNPPRIMQHIGDCYDSIQTITLEEPEAKGAIPNTATAMTAKDGEHIEFFTPFEIQGAVENWLNDLTVKQQTTLAQILEGAIETAVNWDVEKPRHEWLRDYPAQIVLVGTQIYWTEETQAALEEFESGQEDAVKKYLALCNDRLLKLIELVLGKLAPDLRTKIIALITMDVHARDVIQKLIDQKAESPLSFLWQQQLRFYWVADKRDVDIRITDFRTSYSYEWVGNSGRLVITPLTDRCYITLTLALRLMLGGAPAGPAGTGKTETTKDLARALALPCYVFNCSDQMNYQTMADIFKGLAQTGAWGCFDEFNRISIEVLSVVATQVKQCLDAIKLFSVPANREEQYRSAPAGTPPALVGQFELNGDTISLIPTVGFYITMNPGYAGRTELPENLKALFRSCAMIRPDLALICENMLMSEGFGRARPLSIKFVTLYQLSSELLSKQAHYDWGLRAVKSVLRVAGSLKRAEPDIDEEAVLMRALRDFNTPKMPTADLPIFLRLIQDMFPQHYTLPTKMDQSLYDEVVRATKKAKYQTDHGFISKVVQLQELLDVRHSVMLLGPGGCAKTTIWKMLAAAHNQEHTKKPICIYDVVNPKSVTSDELYGFMTLAKDWKDGVLSIIMRGMSKNYKELGYTEHQTMKWVVLDGDIDSLWIESMNTVMDDNKVLTLVSNERIPLSGAMRMLFEINSLENATPATVSRAGILFINETDVGWRPFVESWIAGLDDETAKAHLPGMFDKYIEAIMDATRKGYKSVVPIRLISMIMSTCRLLESMLPEAGQGANADCIEAIFVTAVMWAFGGHLIVDKNENHRKAFHEVISGLMGTVKFPKEPKDAICFDFFFDVNSGEMRLWSERLPEYTPRPIGTEPGETPFGNLFVETVDSVRISTLMDRLVKRGHPVMLVGGAGTGKTTMIKSYLNQLKDKDESWLSCNITMNYYMDSKALQVQLEGAIDKRSGRTYGPPTGKKMVYYVDDLNLPYKEEFGTQNSLSLLRQIVDHKSFFDRGDLGLRKEIVDCQYISSMNPTAGSFAISERLQRFFTTFACLMPSADDLRLIYRSILSGHFNHFKSGFAELAEPIAQASVELHTIMVQKFLPSATKFVYNWNMRELSNIFQGLTLARAEYYPQPLKFLRLWIHECRRVFRDRLISPEDMEAFDNYTRDVSKKWFKGEQEADLFAEPLVYTSFASNPSGEPAYLPVQAGEEGMAHLSKTLVDKLEDYNTSNSIMELVLFEDAMEHVCRIARIIFNPSGNAMLVGVGGSGKQSLSRLASFICGYEVRQLAVTAKFTVNDLRESLKEMYRLAGVKASGIVFLLTDTQIVNDKFLVYVNDMLSSGWISDLFERDEMDAIFGSLRNEAKANDVQDTPDEMLAFFIQRVRKNLHVVLCFSPVGDVFRVRARRFPGLINCTAIDWFHPWPRDALVSVAERFLQDTELGVEGVRENVSQHMAEVHLAVTRYSKRYLDRSRRYNYVTPKSFLELIAFYKHLLGEKRDVAAKQIHRLDVGLSTLRKTAADVAELQVDLKHTLEKVEEKKQATDALLVDITRERAGAEKQQEAAAVEAEKAAVASSKAAEIEAQAAGELAEAEPAMQAARAAVDCLDKASLTELKNFSKPPSGVDQVTACCLMMLEGEFKNLKWDRAKKMMAKVDQFLQSLKDYKAEDMSEDLIKRLTPYTQDPDFSPEVMASKSSAASNLCNWVNNIYKYNRIYVKVKPLMDALEEARGNKAEAQAQLAEVQAEVAEVEARLAELERQLGEANAEKAGVEAEAAACLDRLGLAERLVNGLASENERWGLEIEKLKANEVTLTGDVLLASAFVSYIGAFDFIYRNELWQNVWMPDILERKVPITEGVDPLDLLTTDGKTAQMMNEGLPADRISIENGSIITNCKRWPLMIDPQLQGIKWLRRREENAVILQLTQPNWLRHLTNAVQQGSTVIIENANEEIDATLDPVLARAVYRKGRTLFLRVGGDEVEYDPKFKLYLQTKLSNPHYKPEIQAQCTLINFIATEKGLEDQLLARVVNKEKRELEEQKIELQDAFNRYKIELLELENQLLERLANAPEDILSDVPLIEGLEATKKAATEINAAVVKGRETEKAINKARQVYVPVAQEGAMLYFMITQLNVIQHMYQYSLDSFILYFDKAIRVAVKDEDVGQRVLNLRDTLRLEIYTWVSRGLFEDHKLILLSQLTFQLMRRKVLDTELDPELFVFLMRGPKRVGDSNPLDWLPEPAWNAVQALSDIQEFAKLPSDMSEAPARFKEWFNHVTPEDEKLPLDWAQLDKEPFKKLLVLRCLRPDRLNVALNKFVGATLVKGERFCNCDSTLSSAQVLEACLRDSTPATPLYFILSPGADVVSDVDKLAAKNGLEKSVSYHNVSMGQGQDIIAMQKLENGHKQGHWVLLNNVHLMPRWLIDLEKKLDEFQTEGSHERFRVFLTSDPANTIPIGILNRSIKLTNEPPTGLKANLKRAFCSFSPEQINDADSKIRAILFGLCHFHAIMIERKKFGPKGFNMMYPFGLGDLRDSAVCLNNYMENASSKIPWEDLRYIFGQIMYGGHIVNDFDRLLCVTYLEQFMRDELLDEMELFPFLDDEDKVSFKSPQPTQYENYLEHIDKELKGDTPLAFGLHPNAEIGFRTEQSENLFKILEDLQPRGGGDDEEEASPQRIAENVMQNILDTFGDTVFDLDEINMSIDEKGPFQNVFILECEAMNRLLVEVNRSLNELAMGFAGELTMSDMMDQLMSALFLDRVPPSWGKLAWPSLRSLQGWLFNLGERVKQLQEWVANPMEVPRVTWLSGLINPQSFLTAIMQQTAQRNNLELDKLIIQTDITKRALDSIEQPSRDGCFVHGLALQGARWDTTGGHVAKSAPREMFCPMPVINCRAISLEKAEVKGIYQCPVYKTEQRGPTYVFSAQLRTKAPSARWVMAGVALIMDIVA